jgi:Cof subfamily protein (haloacid dehalogenase superfamily)
MTSPSVVVTDLDGTVVRSDGTISDRSRDAVRDASDAGALVLVATGRPPRWLAGIDTALGHNGLAICANGAIVYDLQRSEVVDAHPVEVDVIRHVMAELRAAVPEVGFAIERVDGLFAHEPSYHPRWEPETDTFIGDLDDVLDAPVAKVLGRREGLDSDELLALARVLVSGTEVSVTHSSIDGLLEISARGVTKASTLEALLAERDLAAPDVVAFGDMPNDIEMLTWVGHGVAVANAHPDVLAVADEVTSSNDDDGVAEVLERLFPSRT